MRPAHTFLIGHADYLTTVWTDDARFGDGMIVRAGSDAPHAFGATVAAVLSFEVGADVVVTKQPDNWTPQFDLEERDLWTSLEDRSEYRVGLIRLKIADHFGLMVPCSRRVVTDQVITTLSKTTLEKSANLGVLNSGSWSELVVVAAFESYDDWQRVLLAIESLRVEHLALNSAVKASLTIRPNAAEIWLSGKHPARISPELVVTAPSIETSGIQEPDWHACHVFSVIESQVGSPVSIGDGNVKLRKESDRLNLEPVRGDFGTIRWLLKALAQRSEGNELLSRKHVEFDIHPTPGHLYDVWQLIESVVDGIFSSDGNNGDSWIEPCSNSSAGSVRVHMRVDDTESVFGLVLATALEIRLDTKLNRNIQKVVTRVQHLDPKRSSQPSKTLTQNNRSEILDGLAQNSASRSASSSLTFAHYEECVGVLMRRVGVPMATQTALNAVCSGLRAAQARPDTWAAMASLQQVVEALLTNLLAADLEGTLSNDDADSTAEVVSLTFDALRQRIAVTRGASLQVTPDPAVPSGSAAQVRLADGLSCALYCFTPAVTRTFVAKLTGKTVEHANALAFRRAPLVVFAQRPTISTQSFGGIPTVSASISHFADVVSLVTWFHELGHDVLRETRAAYGQGLGAARGTIGTNPSLLHGWENLVRSCFLDVPWEPVNGASKLPLLFSDFLADVVWYVSVVDAEHKNRFVEQLALTAALGYRRIAVPNTVDDVASLWAQILFRCEVQEAFAQNFRDSGDERQIDCMRAVREAAERCYHFSANKSDDEESACDSTAELGRPEAMLCALGLLYNVVNSELEATQEAGSLLSSGHRDDSSEQALRDRLERALGDQIRLLTSAFLGFGQSSSAHSYTLNDFCGRLYIAVADAKDDLSPKGFGNPQPMDLAGSYSKVRDALIKSFETLNQPFLCENSEYSRIRPLRRTESRELRNETGVAGGKAEIEAPNGAQLDADVKLKKHEFPPGAYADLSTGQFLVGDEVRSRFHWDRRVAIENLEEVSREVLHALAIEPLLHASGRGVAVGWLPRVEVQPLQEFEVAVTYPTDSGIEVGTVQVARCTLTGVVVNLSSSSRDLLRCSAITIGNVSVRCNPVPLPSERCDSECVELQVDMTDPSSRDEWPVFFERMMRMSRGQ